MNVKKYNRIIRNLIAVSLLVVGQEAAIAVPSLSVWRYNVNDSVCVDTVAAVMDCCVDSTKLQKKTENAYDKLIKQGGSMREGLFTVRHIKDDWYLEVPDSLLNRLMLAVTRFASVPQDFKMISGEESTIRPFIWSSMVRKPF